ncbi:CBS domain-containing protein [Candidatus Woesearchaeota archaeon]|nr:CBS domain-containing protein [Candidatus Woesearchaeota archaeon]
MTKNVVTIDRAATLVKCAKLMASKSVSSLVVTDKRMPLAVIRENDVINGIISKKARVIDAMSREFLIVPPSANFQEVTKALREKKIKKFLVVEKGKLLGLLTETDIIEATRDFTRLHQIMQEIILAVFGLATAFFLFYFSPLKVAVFG